MIKVLTCHLDN